MRLGTSDVNQLINRYEVFCKFTGSNGHHRVNCAHAQIVWPCAKWMLVSPGRYSNQLCLRCVETLRSRNGRQCSKEAVQSVRYAGRRLPMAEAQPIWRTMHLAARSIVWHTYDELFASNSRLRESAFETFACSAEVEKFLLTLLALFNNS